MKLQIQESEERQYTEDPAKLKGLLMRSQKAKIADSEKRSLGYETMTTVSDLDSEVRFSLLSGYHKNLNSVNQMRNLR